MKGIFLISAIVAALVAAGLLIHWFASDARPRMLWAFVASVAASVLFVWLASLP
ncbi:MAG: hypothetical protein ACE5JM_13135 [Armatimonadota bacterium]